MKRKTPAKRMVMQPEFRPLRERSRKNDYSRKGKHKFMIKATYYG